MKRPVTLFTGQWADLPLETLAEKAAQWGYDGLELACWGDHFDVEKAVADPRYCQSRHDILAKHGLKVWALGNHLTGQAVLDRIDDRHRAVLPPRVWGDGDPEGVRRRAAEDVKRSAQAAKAMGVGVVNTLTGSPIWHLFYSFPPINPGAIQAGFDELAARWHPIVDAFDQCNVKLAVEVHPTSIAFDLYTAQMLLDALDRRPAVGFNFDPSHLFWQGVDPVRFIRRFADRIWHVHMKDAVVTLDGESGLLGSHLGFGDSRRGWHFRSVGRGGINFEEIIRALSAAGYRGPLSVEWEDSGMDREDGARDSLDFIRRLDFEPSQVAFDAAFDKRS